MNHKAAPPLPRRQLRWAGHSHVFRKSPHGKSLEDHSRSLQKLGLNYFGFGHPWSAWDRALITEWEDDEEKKHRYHHDQIWRTTDPAFWTDPGRFAEWRAKYSTPDFIFEVDCETPKTRFGHLWWLGWQPEYAPWHDYDIDWSRWEVSEGRRRGEPPPPFTMRFPAQAIRAQVAMGALPVYAHPTSWWWQDGQHITNIASTLVPDILTGQAAGCLVVMGYEANHRHYQELWFNLLNRGYFLTGVAETDACLDQTPFERAVFHNQTSVTNFSTRGIQDEVIAGRNVMTTGPDLRLACGRFGPGDFCPEAGGLVNLVCSRIRPEHSYRLSLIHNGRVVREWTMQGVSEFHADHVHDGGGWIVARLINESRSHDAALTNPVFFQKVPHRVTGHPLPEKEIAWWRLPGALERCSHLANGDWLCDFPGRRPGEIPWEAFQWDDWISLLSNPPRLP